jgi:hypothetical protein
MSSKTVKSRRRAWPALIFKSDCEKAFQEVLINVQLDIGKVSKHPTGTLALATAY